MPKGKTENSVALRDALKEQQKHSSEMRFLHRLHCVLLVSRGHRSVEVAGWFGDDPSSVARWVRHYKEFGLQGLNDDHRSGRPAKLDIDQMSSLEQDLRQEPRTLGYDEHVWNGKLIKAHIQGRFSVELSVRQCQRLLRKAQPPETEPVAAQVQNRS